MEKVSISVVVPVYSGEVYLEALAAEIDALRRGWDVAEAPVSITELVFVDDAAIDGSSVIVDRLAAERPWIVAVRLSRNYGQHAATIAGILHTSGDWIVTLDEDLQHPPKRIAELLERAVADGQDVVYAQPWKGQVHETIWRDGSSRAFKRIMEWLTGNPTIRLMNSFRLIRGPIGRAAASVCSHSTYFDIALFWFTQRIASVEMPLRDERVASGKRSGYNFRRLAGHAQRMLFSSQLRALSIGVWAGGTLFAISIVASLALIILNFASPNAITVRGWTSLFLAVTMSSGFLALMLGLSLQYLSTLVLKAHGRPTFFTIDRSSDMPAAAWFAENPREQNKAA